MTKAKRDVNYRSCDEELRAVRVRASIGHRQQSGLGVLDLEVLVAECRPVDRFAALLMTCRIQVFKLKRARSYDEV